MAQGSLAGREVTVSAGVAAGEAAQGLSPLLERAQEALLRARDKGPGRVAAAG